MAKLVVSTWACGGGLRARTMTERLRKLEKGIALTHARSLTNSSLGDGLVRAVFAAPEYLLSKRYAGFKTGAGALIPFTIDTTKRDRVVRDLLALSTRYPRVLIFPGTVAWQRPIDDATVERHLKYYAQRIPNASGIPEANLNALLKAEFRDAEGYLVGSSERDEFFFHHGFPMDTTPIDDRRIKWVRENSPRFYLYMVAVVTSPYGGLGGVIGAAEKARNRISGGATDMMFNTAYALLNGRIIGTYHKQGNFHEEKDVATTAFLPGAGKGIFDFEGYRCGLEICLDHNIGVMRSQLRREPLDLHIVLSDYVEWDHANTLARNGGYFIHASTNPKVNGVWQRTPTGMQVPPRLGTDTVAGFPLEHFEVDLENRQNYSLADTFMADLPGRDPGKAPAKKWAPVQTPSRPFRNR